VETYTLNPKPRTLNLNASGVWYLNALNREPFSPDPLTLNPTP